MDLNFVNVMAANFFETKNDVLFLIFRPGPRDATLDFENGEFICPMCRQVANALLPVPPDAPRGTGSNALATCLHIWQINSPFSRSKVAFLENFKHRNFILKFPDL